MEEALELSEDQSDALEAVSAALKDAGVTLGARKNRRAPGKGGASLMAVIGKAGSGKTMLLARLCQALEETGVEFVTGDHESRKRGRRRTLAVLAPTNKAASVLRGVGVPATTIHRIIYTPVYDPEFQKVADWLAGEGPRPKAGKLSDEALDRAKAFHDSHRSIPGALASAGLRGTDFITGWERRDDPLDIGIVDEASMLDDKALDDLREIFPTLVLFGDPAQLAPVGQSGRMAFERVPEGGTRVLHQVHRQAADNPIRDLARSLDDEDIGFGDFEDAIRDIAARDDRVVMSQRVDSDMMARSPVLVWRNATRIRLIQGFRNAFGVGEDELKPGEPLVCDGMELPMKHRKRRIELEIRGLIKGAQAVYLGPGNRPGFARVHVFGAENPQFSVASIIRVELPGRDEPLIPCAAGMGATFLHGAAVTIHKAQGSQWPEVQVYAPDLLAAARSELVEAGLPLWKRLAYVAVTRAQERLHWVTRPALARPKRDLATDDLSTGTLKLEEGQ